MSVVKRIALALCLIGTLAVVAAAQRPVSASMSGSMNNNQEDTTAMSARVTWLR